MPFDYNSALWGFPKNLTLENDILPFWRDYSDYIGFNLWADQFPPSGSYSPDAEIQVEKVLVLASQYSQLFNKPIHINEFPCWYANRVEKSLSQ